MRQHGLQPKFAWVLKWDGQHELIVVRLRCQIDLKEWRPLTKTSLQLILT